MYEAVCVVYYGVLFKKSVLQETRSLALITIYPMVCKTTHFLSKNTDIHISKWSHL